MSFWDSRVGHLITGASNLKDSIARKGDQILPNAKHYYLDSVEADPLSEPVHVSPQVMAKLKRQQINPITLKAIPGGPAWKAEQHEAKRQKQEAAAKAKQQKQQAAAQAAKQQAKDDAIRQQFEQSALRAVRAKYNDQINAAVRQQAYLRAEGAQHVHDIGDFYGQASHDVSHDARALEGATARTQAGLGKAITGIAGLGSPSSKNTAIGARNATAAAARYAADRGSADQGFMHRLNGILAGEQTYQKDNTLRDYANREYDAAGKIQDLIRSKAADKAAAIGQSNVDYLKYQQADQQNNDPTLAYSDALSGLVNSYQTTHSWDAAQAAALPLTRNNPATKAAFLAAVRAMKSDPAVGKNIIAAGQG